MVAAGLKLADGGSLIYDEAAEMLLRVTDSSISMHSLAQPQQAPRVGLYIPHQGNKKRALPAGAAT